jgi:small subunit ribosomal protein S1
MGAIVGRVKGGFTVDLGGASAFLPGSQVDIRPVRDVGPLMGKEQPFAILKMDRPRGNIVVSRRAILEEARAEQRTELVSQLQEGEIREGVVKNITDYGAFVDLGGIDGLLHVTDMSWKRVNHPSQVLAVGDTVKVQIVKINPDTQRISLGMKQLQSDPWDGVEAKYPVGAKFTGRITNITDYGAFVELEAGVEGLVHVSEMSWTKKNVHPGKIVSTSQEVDVVVLDVDPSKRRVSLGLKQAMANPWDAFVEPIRSARPSKAKSRTPPSSACSSASRTTSTAWSTCPTSTGRPPVKRRWPATPRATSSRPRSSTSTSRRSASAWASSSWLAIR